MSNELIKYLSDFITENRKKLFEEVLDLRTKYITVVLEDIYQPHNASAILRTCDCFGIQDVHIIENKNKYNVNPDVALGSFKWLNMIKYNQTTNNTKAAIEELRNNNYRIVATIPNSNNKCVELTKFDLETGKIALFFGTELTGLSNIAIDYADEFLKIPMYGFTESFNISVSAAIILYHLTLQLRNSNIDWKIPENEQSEITLNWLRNSINKSDILEKEFLHRNLKNNINKSTK